MPWIIHRVHVGMVYLDYHFRNSWCLRMCQLLGVTPGAQHLVTFYFGKRCK